MKSKEVDEESLPLIECRGKDTRLHYYPIPWPVLKYIKQLEQHIKDPNNSDLLLFYPKRFTKGGDTECY